jgi:hypothetical protein
MRVSEAALALITRVNPQGETEYLTQWNEKWQAYSLIGGHVASGETFRTACQREIVEELHCANNEFEVAFYPYANLQFREYSKSAREETDYHWQAFVTRIDEALSQRLPANCVWVPADHIRSGRTIDGKPIADQVRRILKAVDEANHNLSWGSWFPGVCETTTGGPMTDEIILASHTGSDAYPTVTWMADARRDLSDELCRQVEDELSLALDQGRPPTIIVKQRFRGFSDEPLKKLILAVDVQDDRGAHASVVKIGTVQYVRGDHTGWQTCAVKRGVSSRMFIAPILRDVGAGRVVIIYPDVYQYYYDNGREDEPHELEAIVDQCIARNLPTVGSVERILTQVFTEAHRCFYRVALEDVSGQQVYDGITRSLRFGESDPVFDRWKGEEYLKLRRGAAWLTCGRRQPDSNVRPEYIDPVDFLAWAVANRAFPKMLVGPAHGDLHGRNVIVGVVRGEAEWPAVFDFDKMTDQNLVAWDFAKLELELKCRLFQQLLESPADRDQARELLGMTPRRPFPTSIHLKEDDHRVQRRAERMEIMFAIERCLHAWTRSISSLGEASRSDVDFAPAVPADTPLGRALQIIFRIRREAAVYLGFDRQGRENCWVDEYYFGLATYGVVTAKWHSANDHLAWALLSSGVAVAGLSQFPWPPDSTCSTSTENLPSYLHLLPNAHACWKTDRAADAVDLLKRGIQQFPYAVALRQQLALSLAHSDCTAESETARREIEALANLACVFRDHETLCRLGRIYKDRGDHLFDGSSHRESIEERLPSWQHYQVALKHYRHATEVSGDYYPAVNVATLAMLVGNVQEQTRFAEYVLVTCGQLPVDSDYRTWILASEGEASLLLGHIKPAVIFYRSAVERILPGETGIVQSLYNQLCRLHWALGRDAVQPVIDMLQQAKRLDGIKPGPFNNCGRPV